MLSITQHIIPSYFVMCLLHSWWITFHWGWTKCFICTCDARASTIDFSILVLRMCSMFLLLSVPADTVSIMCYILCVLYYVLYIMCFILCGTFIVCKSSISQSILIQYMNVVEIYCVTSYYLCFKSSIINYPYYIRYHVAKCSEACPLYLHPLFAAPVMHGWIQKFCRFHLQQETATLWNLNGWPSDQSAFW